FALAGLFALLTTLVGSDGALGVLFDYLSTLNLILAVFNLVPGFPLDGGRLLRAALWARSGDLMSATRRASLVGQGFGWLLITLGAALVLTGGGVAGLWWILIGLFLNGAAKQSYEQLLVHSAFAALPVDRLLSHPPIVVAADLPLDRFVEDFAYRHHFSLFPVVDQGRLVGTIRTRRVAEMPRGQWPHHTVGELVRPLTPDDMVQPHESAETALQRMQRNGRGQILVVEGDRLLGVLTLHDLLEHLAIRRMLDQNI
ncbi:MAG: CBS domain-containing protein, partial [Alphaproteobacteria bacterium]